MRFVKFLKRVKRIHFIVEAEEIYGDVRNNIKTTKKELRFFSKADRYLIPTIMLNNKINKQSKPYSICHGIYKVESKCTEKFNDGKIHCVYAGTFERTKGGAQMAVQAALHLTKKYYIHILGFGNKHDEEELKKLIDDVNKKTQCVVTYEGSKSGKEYTSFLQKCDIGLSTQTSVGEYNDSSFPSKILSYLSNGLSVVSISIPVVVTSAVRDCISLYEKPNPLEIANAIMRVNNDSMEKGYRTIQKLDAEFRDSITHLLDFAK